MAATGQVERLAGQTAASRRVIVTGGSGGIGREIVRAFLAAGDRVANLDREPFPESAGRAGSLTTVPVDLAEPASIAQAFRQADTAFDGAAPDVLVCCAAFSRAAPFLEVGLADLDAMLALNARGTFLCGQEAGRRMRSAGRGHIVVITSIAAAQAWAGESVYCLTKAAQASLVQSMAIELAPFGILVNAVAPGIIEAKSQGMAGSRQGEIYRHEMERFPLGRFGAPGEIAAGVLHLSRATWMTGQTLTIDGGFMAAGLGYFGQARAKLIGGTP